MRPALITMDRAARLGFRARALQLLEARDLELAVATMFPVAYTRPPSEAHELGRAGFAAIEQGPDAVLAWVDALEPGAGLRRIA